LVGKRAIEIAGWGQSLIHHRGHRGHIEHREAMVRLAEVGLVVG